MLCWLCGDEARRKVMGSDGKWWVLIDGNGIDEWFLENVQGWQTNEKKEVKQRTCLSKRCEKSSFVCRKASTE